MAKEISLSFAAKRTQHKLMKFCSIYQHFINYKVHKVNFEADFVKFRTKKNRAIIAQKYNEFWRNLTKLRSLNHYRKLRNFVSFRFVTDRNLSLDPNFAVTYFILLSIVCTFLHWKWCWNIPYALYMEGSCERV